MDEQSDTVTQAMHKRFTQARSGQTISGNGICFSTSHARSNLRQRGKLRLEHASISLSKRGVSLADDDRSGQVGAVTIDLGPHVDDDRLTFGNCATRRIMVRSGAVWPRCDDDRKTDAGCTKP